MDIRCFVALELPPDIRVKCGAFTRNLASISRGVKWVQEENLHLTLKFLGSTLEDKLPAIKDALSIAAKPHSPLHITLKGTGVFPSRRRPRVVWIGMEGGPGLFSLQASVESAMEGLGYAREAREFTAHMTLGRVNKDRFSDLSALLKALDESRDAVFGEFDAGSIALIKSDLKPAGAVYTRLFEAGLGG